jgi:hypothetical protein
VQRWVELILVGAASAVLGGLLLESFRSRARRYWQTRQENRQEERLLREFLDMARGHPDGTLAAHLSARTAAARARIRDPEAVLKRLLHKAHIRVDTRSSRITSILASRGDSAPTTHAVASGSASLAGERLPIGMAKPARIRGSGRVSDPESVVFIIDTTGYAPRCKFMHATAC